MTVPPTFAQRFDAAMQLATARRTHEAAQAFGALARAQPAHVPTRRMLGALLHELGRGADALAELDAAARLAPGDAGIQAARSDLLLGLGQVEAAEQAALGALRLDPASAAAQLRFGLALAAGARWQDAIAPLRDALARQPGLAGARVALVQCRLMLGEPGQALVEACDPGLLDVRDAFQRVIADFAAAGALSHRADLLERYLQRHPRDADAALALAADLHALGRPSAALRWSEHALRLRPERLATEIRAASLIDRGDVEAGLAAYRELPGDRDAQAAARHLVLMHYDPAQDNARLFAAHRDFAQRYLRAGEPPFAPSASGPDRPLRIGWVSPRIGAGPVATFLHGLLAQFERDGFHHLLVALQPVRDAAGARLVALADEFVDASGLDDARLLQRLRDLRLDVLVDLAGHSTANRLPVLARRVAPLQLCWLDWFDTTAAPAMDAWISDGWLTPADSTQRHTEQVVRLAAGRLCYTPPDDSPAPMHDGGGTPVFASFNRLAKLNDGVVDTWARILHRVAGARLELRAGTLAEPATRARLHERFARRGIGAERVGLYGELPYPDLLRAYRHVDIALDPFPFSGCATTCDALWMGCPAVALAGETFVSRQSASLLSRLGRDEWIARDRAGYIDCAVALAHDIEAVRANRPALRESVLHCLCDARAQATEFASALRVLWRSRCAQPA